MADPLASAIAEGEEALAQSFNHDCSNEDCDKPRSCFGRCEDALRSLLSAARSAQERITAAEKLTEETQKSASAWMRLQKETEREANASLDRALKAEGERDRMRSALSQRDILLNTAAAILRQHGHWRIADEIGAALTPVAGEEKRR